MNREKNQKAPSVPEKVFWGGEGREKMEKGKEVQGGRLYDIPWMHGSSVVFKKGEGTEGSGTKGGIRGFEGGRKRGCQFLPLDTTESWIYESQPAKGEKKKETWTKTTTTPT